jgi:hypothetical protein
MDKQPKKRKKDVTPITDGDTRPDQSLNPKHAKPENKKKTSVTENRKGDINTLEDYKDAI